MGSRYWKDAASLFVIARNKLATTTARTEAQAAQRLPADHSGTNSKPPDHLKQSTDKLSDEFMHARNVNQRYSISNDFTGSYEYRILMLKRSRKSSFMPLAYVYPGGVTEINDISKEWLQLYRELNITEKDLGTLSDVSRGRPPILENTDGEGQVNKDLMFRITAIREAFEEAGILLCKSFSVSPLNTERQQSDGSTYCSLVPETSAIDWKQWRKKVQKDPSEFLTLCREVKCYPDVFSLYEWSNWLTPIKWTKRFDTLFFMTFLDHIPSATLDHYEVTDLEWTTPQSILEKYHDEQLWLAPPQVYESCRLLNFQSIEKLAAFASDRAKKGITRWLSVVLKAKDGTIILLPGDGMYPENPDYIGTEPDLETEKTLEEIRASTLQLNRMEFRSPNDCKIFTNITPVHGHMVPVDH